MASGGSRVYTYAGPLRALDDVRMIWLLLSRLLMAQSGGEADILSYPIGAGDVVGLEVIGEEEMSRSVRVGANGTIEVPLAGSLVIAGLTVDEATRAITAHLAGRFLVNPQIVLKIDEFASKRVDVTGGVNTPATYSLQSAHTRVSQVLLMAGGLVDPSAPVVIVRRQRDGVWTDVRVDLEKVNRGDAGADIEVFAGDQIYVPPVERVYVQGEVQKPGPVPYNDGLTVRQAVIIAGGPSDSARLTGAYIMRGEEKIKINLRQIIAGQQADISLRPSDTIVIPESPI